ncbi:MAG: hypothetical protein IV093_14435 [Rubrivivax sp.]|nr:hypothetical protein [Rubrivivax sp.]
MKALPLRGAWWAMLTLATAGSGVTPASAARDPLQPPAALRSSRPAADGSVPAPAADPVIRHLVTVDGQRYVLDGARRYGMGDRLGTLRIDCIHDHGVTVRDAAGQARELPLYGRVDIRPAGASAPRPAPRPTPCLATRPAPDTPKRSAR